jgi:hypothetical protein
VKNISEILWDSECTGVEEYLLRKWFYGNLNKLSDLPISASESEKEELFRRIESISTSIPDYEYYGGRSGITSPEDFGWKELYSRELRDYLKRGVESFNIS